MDVPKTTENESQWFWQDSTSALDFSAAFAGFLEACGNMPLIPKKIPPENAAQSGEGWEFTRPLLLHPVSQIEDENNKRAQKIPACEYMVDFSRAGGTHQEALKKNPTNLWEKKIDLKHLGFNR